MGRYEPFTPRGLELRDLNGWDDDRIAEYEAGFDTRGQMELMARHPEAANPEMMQRVALEIAQNADKYRRRLEHEGAGEIYEDAFLRASRQQPGPAPDPGTAYGRVTPGKRLDPSELDAAQAAYRATGELSPGLVRRLGYSGAIEHFDIRREPGE